MSEPRRLRSHTRRATDTGFTLVEVVVALGLFALIAAAGASLVTTVLNVQQHTAGRLDRLAELERAMSVVTRDLTEVVDAPLTGNGTTITFVRHHDRGGGPAGVGYRLVGARLERVADGRPQLLLADVAAMRWHYYAPPDGWQDHWPADVAQARTWPAAVALDLDLAGPPPHGHLRRIVDLPVRPLPAGTATPGSGIANLGLKGLP